MRKFLLVIIACLTSTLLSHSQSPLGLWAASANNGNSAGHTIAVDSSGNSYVCGTFNSDSIQIGSVTLYNQNTVDETDVFIVKYDVTGNVVWVHSAGSSDIDDVYGICVDALGNVYVTGSFSGPVMVFDSIPLNSVYPSDEVFLVKYNSSGTFEWAKAYGGMNFDQGRSVCVDSYGDVYLTGFFHDDILFGNHPLSVMAGDVAMFLVKLDANGNVQWAKQSSGPNVYTLGVAADTYGNVFVTGAFYGTVAFDGQFVYSTGVGDVFLAKYDSFGNIIWIKTANGDDSDYSFGVSTDASGNAYITGTFESPSLIFDSDTVYSSFQIPNTWQRDIFIAKYDAAGNVQWIKTTGGPYTESCSSIQTNAAGESVIAGYYESDVFTIGNFQLLNDNSIIRASNFFAAKIDSSGDVLWAKSGSTSFDIHPNMAYGAAIDNDGFCYITGVFESDLQINNNNVYANGDQFFVLRIDTAVIPVGIDYLSDELSGILVWPNPSSGIFSIRVDESSTIKIHNQIGECVYTNSEVINEIKIDLHDLQSGVYFISVESDKGRSTGKIIIAH